MPAEQTAQDMEQIVIAADLVGELQALREQAGLTIGRSSGRQRRRCPPPGDYFQGGTCR
jgi:hypothetical protein